VKKLKIIIIVIVIVIIIKINFIKGFYFGVEMVLRDEQNYLWSRDYYFIFEMILFFIKSHQNV
jgi:hypothetical protein